MDAILELSVPTDEQLAADAAREGSDGPAFQALLDRYRRHVWSICYRLLGHAEDANDAAQEVFVRLFVHRARFDGRSKYSTWVYGVAVRTCLAIRRGRGRRRRHEEAATSEARLAAPQQQADSAALAIDLSHMLECLDEEDRAMVILKYAEGYSYDELAAIFELTPSACKMRVSRARDKIQERFGNTT